MAKNIEQLFCTKIINKDLYHIYQQKGSNEEYLKIQKYENQFKKVNFFKKKIYCYGSKYYLQNKKKAEFTGIQESLREKIVEMNNTFPENYYFIDITKSIRSKEGNKHVYNVFNINLFEYQRMNLLDDIIAESEDFYSEMFFPITLSNLDSTLRIKLYEKIIKFLKKNEDKVDEDLINDISYHNKLLLLLKKEIYEFFIVLFKIDNNMKKIMKNLLILEPNCNLSECVDVEKMLNYFFVLNKKHLLTINQVLDVYLKKKWALSMNILNVEVLQNLSDNIKEDEILIP